MNEQEQFETWFANDTKGLDRNSARAGWVERMAREQAATVPEGKRYLAITLEDLAAVSGDNDPSTGKSEAECRLLSFLIGLDVRYSYQTAPAEADRRDAERYRLLASMNARQLLDYANVARCGAGLTELLDAALAKGEVAE